MGKSILLGVLSLVSAVLLTNAGSSAVLRWNLFKGVYLTKSVALPAILLQKGGLGLILLTAIFAAIFSVNAQKAACFGYKEAKKVSDGQLSFWAIVNVALITILAFGFRFSAATIAAFVIALVILAICIANMIISKKVFASVSNEERLQLASLAAVSK